MGEPLAAPGADGERFGVHLHERVLVGLRELHHGELARGLERHEDLPADAEVRVAHVLAFHRSGTGEGDLPGGGDAHHGGLLSSALRPTALKLRQAWRLHEDAMRTIIAFPPTAS